MANFLVDPYPFVPLGFTLIPREVDREPMRMRSFLAFSLDKVNEDLAIAITVPPVAKIDFVPFARELHRYLLDHQVRHSEIQQCPMGEAFVHFDSPMQRDSFVNSAPRLFDGYQLRFIRHDEGVNFKDLELDRVVWLMLLYFPPDARNLISLVDKSIAGFGQLLHVHGSSSLARLIVKVLVNKDADIPESITVSAGTDPRIRTWTVPIFLLQASDVVLGGDEQPLPVDGPIHPITPPAPRWMGPHGPGAGAAGAADGSAAGGADNAGSNSTAGGQDAEAVPMEDLQVPSGQELMEHSEQTEQGQQGQHKDQITRPEQSEQGQKVLSSQCQKSSAAYLPIPVTGSLKTLEQGPSTLQHQVITLSVNCLPPLFTHDHTFRYINRLIVDLNIKVPEYLSDLHILWYLAKVVHDPSEITASGRKRKLVLEPELYAGKEKDDDKAPSADDDDLKIISKEEAVIKTPRKHRARKPRSPLEKKFVRRSRRLNTDLDGFRDQESKDAHAAAEEEDIGVEAALDPLPLAVLPPSDELHQGYSSAAAEGSTPSPFLSVDNALAMATGYLKMQAGSVSAAALLASSDDEE
ncbi:unnamed protein product [Urochloa humidicola]